MIPTTKTTVQAIVIVARPTASVLGQSTARVAFLVGIGMVREGVMLAHLSVSVPMRNTARAVSTILTTKTMIQATVIVVLIYASVLGQSTAQAALMAPSEIPMEDVMSVPPSAFATMKNIAPVVRTILFIKTMIQVNVISALPIANARVQSTAPAAFLVPIEMIWEGVRNVLPPASVIMKSTVHRASWACPSMSNRMCVHKFVEMDWC